ncbi:M48 family metallopeptidase [Roseibacterium sp. SDUM158017]|uniref:M48 family metallopeptidase n=1 Tax=Roseicyclus salinarum TaxID=3036773 RepID=UPI0024158242|nr:M48 family metallopeptidase [Roseibacterium sp. SDUM158017]MDG4648258.1 M48 family metallopeptidase [Roseibacterium sp. SDUM158017]
MRSRLSAALVLFALALVSACGEVPAARPAEQPAFARPPALAPQAFLDVAQDVEPVAEAVCRAETPDQNCDFAILVDRDPNAGVNAFQTVDRAGRPVVVLTLGLIAILENEAELAFVLGHEAGHHIARHIPEQRQQAEEGARIFGEMAISRGASERDVARAAELGAFVGARSYSRSAELEADAIGTVIAFRAGYDPVLGARLFARLPEPRMRLLSTHPPNAQRMDVVRRTLAGLGAGG